MPHSVSSL